jgi:hypothetical protein
MKLLHLTFVVAAALAAHVAAADGPISMQLRRVFEGYSINPEPVIVELSNSGPDAAGTLFVNFNSTTIEHPVELPQNSTKRFTVYPSSALGAANFSLVTNRGTMTGTLQDPQPVADTGKIVALISDEPGSMSFLRVASGKASSLAAVYCRPEDAPDRPVGYEGVNTVVLGRGAERLSDATVTALKEWVVMGGSVVFFGGSSTPVLEDPRWRAITPVEDAEPVSVSQSPALARLGGAPTPAATFLSGEAVPEAIVRSEGDHLISAERRVGLGKVLLLGFNPLEAPLDAWSGRRQALTNALRLSDRQRSYSFYHTTSPATPMTMSSGSTQTDPFSTKLPDGSQIVGLLTAYFFLVVPINFLILKRMKRGELTWVTAPVLALGFSGVLFTSAGSLYGAELSVAHQGHVIAYEGLPNGMFTGESSLFIPRGGYYDLKLSGVDQLQEISRRDYTSTSAGSISFADVGEVKIDRLRTSNLAFKEFWYRQEVPAGKWFSIQPLGDGKWQISNTGPYRLDEPSLNVGGRSIAIAAPIEPGATVTVSEKDLGKESDDLVAFVKRQGGVALRGTLPDFRPGPQIGTVVPDRTYIQLTFFAEETQP